MKLCGKELIKLNLEITGDIGQRYPRVSKSNGYTVVRDFVGYGIGEVFIVLQMYYIMAIKGEGITIQEGMILLLNQ